MAIGSVIWAVLLTTVFLVSVRTGSVGGAVVFGLLLALFTAMTFVVARRS
jgi:hypothetical protein